MRTKIVLLCMVLLLSASATVFSACVQDGPVDEKSAFPDLEFVPPAGWQQVDSRTGLNLWIPPGWAVRANIPHGFAAWPDPFSRPGESANTGQSDGVRVTSVAEYVETIDGDSDDDALQSAIERMRGEGFTPGPPRQAYFDGEPATVVNGTKATGAKYVVVSREFVLEGWIIDGAPRSGHTTENVGGVLRSAGLQEIVWSW